MLLLFNLSIYSQLFTTAKWHKRAAQQLNFYNNDRKQKLLPKILDNP